jgi:hypothetical protein
LEGTGLPLCSWYVLIVRGWWQAQISLACPAPIQGEADPDTRVVIHHARGHGDVIATRIVSEGGILLDPAGLTIALSAVFGLALQAQSR